MNGNLIKALLDANVLYSAAMRDVLMMLAVFGVYKPHWTHQIHEEWLRNVLLNRPDVSRVRLENTRNLMDSRFPGALVSNYEHWIEQLNLPDADDRHVLAAAI